MVQCVGQGALLKAEAKNIRRTFKVHRGEMEMKQVAEAYEEHGRLKKNLARAEWVAELPPSGNERVLNSDYMKIELELIHLELSKAHRFRGEARSLRAEAE